MSKNREGRSARSGPGQPIDDVVHHRDRSDGPPVGRLATCDSRSLPGIRSFNPWTVGRLACVDASQIGKVLLVGAVVLALLGLVFLAGSALRVSRIPGDLSFGKRNVRVHVPIATSVILSILATVVLNLLFRGR